MVVQTAAIDLSAPEGMRLIRHHDDEVNEEAGVYCAKCGAEVEVLEKFWAAAARALDELLSVEMEARDAALKGD